MIFPLKPLVSSVSYSPCRSAFSLIRSCALSSLSASRAEFTCVSSAGCFCSGFAGSATVQPAPSFLRLADLAPETSTAITLSFSICGSSSFRTPTLTSRSRVARNTTKSRTNTPTTMIVAFFISDALPKW